MICSGIIKLYSIDNVLIEQYKYRNADDRKKKLLIWRIDYWGLDGKEKLYYYQIVPDLRVTNAVRKEREPIKVPITRHKPVYNNIPTYQYKDEVR